MNEIFQFLLTILLCTSLPLSLWLAYRLGHKVSDTEWEETIEWSDDPDSLRRSLDRGRQRMESEFLDGGWR